MTPPVPSSPQRGLADRMFLDGPANRLSTCEPRPPHNLLWYSHILTLIHYIRRIKPDLFLLSRLWPRVPLAECHQRQTIHPEPEGDRQPAQVDAALKTLGMLGRQMCRDCGSVAHICMKELEGFFYISNLHLYLHLVDTSNVDRQGNFRSADINGVVNLCRSQTSSTQHSKISAVKNHLRSGVCALILSLFCANDVIM